MAIAALSAYGLYLALAFGLRTVVSSAATSPSAPSW